jgi:Fe-Mn family superoxide dismutase
LPYAYKALEPVISGEIMELHHQKHHATYVNNLNSSEDKLKECIDRDDIDGVIGLQGALRFNGGGHINHSIFWNNLSPNGGGLPTGELSRLIERDFGSFDNFQSQMTSMTVAVQGSGWGWLGYDIVSDRLRIITCPNQDPLQATTGI